MDEDDDEDEIDGTEKSCALCGRVVGRLTKHHLIPRTRHKNKRNKKLFDRALVTKTELLCRPCHSNVHAVLSEKTLEREYSTLELLAACPEVSKFTEWIKRKPDGFRVQVRESKDKR